MTQAQSGHEHHESPGALGPEGRGAIPFDSALNRPPRPRKDGSVALFVLHGRPVEVRQR